MNRQSPTISTRIIVYSLLQRVQRLAPEWITQGHGVYRNHLVLRPSPFLIIPFSRNAAEPTLAELGLIQVAIQDIISQKGWTFVCSPKFACVCSSVSTPFIARGPGPAIALLKAFCNALEGQEKTNG